MIAVIYLGEVVVGLSSSLDLSIVEEEQQRIIPVYRRYKSGRDILTIEPAIAICLALLSQDGQYTNHDKADAHDPSQQIGET
jgi:hypothetical protein